MFKESSQLDIPEEFVSWDKNIIKDADTSIEQKEDEELKEKNERIKNDKEFIEQRDEMMEEFAEQIASEKGDTDEKLTKLEKKLAEQLVKAIENYKEKPNTQSS